jgi:hypothetical protein
MSHGGEKEVADLLWVERGDGERVNGSISEGRDGREDE